MILIPQWSNKIVNSSIFLIVLLVEFEKHWNTSNKGQPTFSSVIIIDNVKKVFYVFLKYHEWKVALIFEFTETF